VATRIIVQRERDRMAFRSAVLLDIIAQLDASVSDPTLSRQLHRTPDVGGRPARRHRPRFRFAGTLRKANEVTVSTKPARRSWPPACMAHSYRWPPSRKSPTPGAVRAVHDVDLQQEAGRKLRFSSERTMSIAQRLYENGYITYMRTDSTTLSTSQSTRAHPGAPALRRGVRLPVAAAVHRKVKNARRRTRHPAGGRDIRYPGPVRRELDGDEIPAVRADLAAHGRLADAEPAAPR